MSEKLTGKNYIGNLLASTGSHLFKTFNPVLNTENPTVFTEASILEINQAVVLASQAFDAFKNTSIKDRAAFLNAIVKEIERLDFALIKQYCLETGLTEQRAEGERTRTLHQLRSFAQHILEGKWMEASIDSSRENKAAVPSPDLRKINIALGPVVVFGASNFPLAYSTAGGDTASAFAAGCPVIVKSHPMHAGTGEMIASAIIKAAEDTGMPNGVFSNLNSKGIEVGLQLVSHPLVKAVGFTGSIQAGRALYNLASKRPEPIPFFGEMGSVNPVILLPNELSINAHKWANTYADSITLGAGQFCTNPGLILGLKSSSLDDFLHHLAKKVEEKSPLCMLHPSIYKNFEHHKKTLSEQKGVDIVARYNEDFQENFGSQTIATVSGSDFLNNKTVQQEVFGPFSMVVQCQDKEELTAIIRSLDGQLTGTIIGNTEDLQDYSAVINQLKNRVGRLIFNGVSTGVEVCPSMFHGGPYPASTDSRFTAVGIDSIKRWLRPFSYQNCPDHLLPEGLKNSNPLKISRRINGVDTMNNL
ncbi:MAG: aldehyde dehydrogenase (NADP(+)) [Flavobacteriaceae bacterium]|nr:MAG: aldehyde dehydrogenase (NADP(+)) [Flavobacteriaceae bacterium]